MVHLFLKSIHALYYFKIKYHKNSSLSLGYNTPWAKRIFCMTSFILFSLSAKDLNTWAHTRKTPRTQEEGKNTGKCVLQNLAAFSVVSMRHLRKQTSLTLAVRPPYICSTALHDQHDTSRMENGLPHELCTHHATHWSGQLGKVSLVACVSVARHVQSSHGSALTILSRSCTDCGESWSTYTAAYV